ncbi:dephospho-CoA kinase [Aestuariibius sp. HNIBRBA575]|uniref:dephospho-CoA kinase n=1 Tax=Aestuariibius sp. HNIBRBA575 TaxID=3233343 RepID=UPI0034A3A387
MGKSTTAQMFRDAGLDVWDADAAVHRLYAKGGAAVSPIRATFPSAIEAGTVSRERLKQIIAQDNTALSQIEKIVHPLVAADRADFIDQATSDIVVLDIPLLFETNSESQFSGILVVSAPAELQKNRVLARAGMTEAQFDTILARQVPDTDKRAKADFVIETIDLEQTRQSVTDLIADIRRNHIHA